MLNQLRAEARKTFATALWWALGVAAVALSLLFQLLGALGNVRGALGAGDVIVLAVLGQTLQLIPLFGATVGIVGAAGEFARHTAAGTYLAQPRRERVLVAKMTLSAGLGALYALAAAAAGLLLGLLVVRAAPPFGALAAQVVVGAVVAALWAAIGAGLGIAVGNQVGALIGTLCYLLVVERLLERLLTELGLIGLQRLLPGDATGFLISRAQARPVQSGGLDRDLSWTLRLVDDPWSFWAALLVLIGWTVGVGALGWVLGARRDVG